MNKIWKKDYPLQEHTEESLGENTSLKIMLNLVGENQRVIDFGCATGYFSQLLTKKGCRVTGVELNPDAARVAEQYCEQVIVADLDLVQLSEILPGQAFDVAIFGDTLEHLRDPWRVLKETHQLLNAEGYVVASIPNIAHGSIRLALLQGRFEYTELGILDNTHLRFFTRKTVEELFGHTGYFIDTLERTKLPIFSEAPLIPPIDKNGFGSEIFQKIEQEEEAETFQFIVRAFSGDKAAKYAVLKERYSKVFEQFEQSQAQLQHTQAELEQSQAQLQHTQAELEQSQVQRQQAQMEAESAQAQLQHTQAELEQSQAQLQHTQLELEQSQAQLQHTQLELEQSQAQLQQAQMEAESAQAQLQHTQTELEQSQAQLQQAQMEAESAQAQLQHTQTELEQSQATISGMESSKFWKLRKSWLGLKQAIGLTDGPPSTASTDSSCPQTTESPTGFVIPDVTNIKEINFKVASKSPPSGFFDGVNGSAVTKIEVQTATPITARGWAILADEGRPADRVIVTYGKKNSLVAVASVNLERPDVAKALENPAYSKSGWSITLATSNLPKGQIVLKAWAYNSARKEAIQLGSKSFNPQTRNLLSRLKHRYAVLKVKGMRYALARLSKRLYHKLDGSQLPIEVIPAVADNNEPYYKWLSKNFPRETELQKMAETVEIFFYKPVISVIMPVFNTPSHILRQAIESVLNQVYPYWELCIADDASTKSYIRTVLEEYVAKDSRIKVAFRNENGHISRASNSALEIATGEFIALLDHDDLLTPDALYEVALLLNKHPETDMIYSDEDKINEQNQLKDPFFKPDWCPDSFLSRMYTSHLGIYQRSLVVEIGGFRAGYEGSQDYDLVLRLTEKTENIFHIPKILYHWRIHSDSTASNSANKSYATDAAKRAISDALERRNEPGKVIAVAGGHHIVRYEIKDFKLVSIIIPTKNLGSVLNRCLESIFEKTTYVNYEVLLIDNGSTEAETHEVINKWRVKEQDRFRCDKLDIPFNFSRINNYAVKQAKGEYLLFLNNDTEVVTHDWLEAMVEQAQRPCIGAVGALLLYPDDTIQHAGVVSVGGVAGHSHKHYDSNSHGYFNQIQTINNYSAVTGACLMCRREVFEAVGGFEEELTVAFNDIDLCFKMIEKGYRNICLPHAVLYHYESKSRGYEDTPKKQARFIKEINYAQNKWGKFIGHDPCYSPNLTREREDYSIRK